MVETNQNLYTPNKLEMTIPALFVFGMTIVVVAGVTQTIFPNGNLPFVISIAAGVIVCHKATGYLHPVISVLAVFALASLIYLERYPSNKSCEAMESSKTFVEEEQVKAQEYWEKCSNPSSDDQYWCTDYKPERTMDSLKDELDYLSDRIAKRCR